MIIINAGIVHSDIDEIDEISIISLIKLSDGGAAMFEDANMNHHMDIIGIDDISPFIKNSLRV